MPSVKDCLKSSKACYADSMGVATVIVDASFCKETQAGGWAAYIRIGEKSPIKVYGKLPAHKDSYAAELDAAFRGIEEALKHGASSILLQSDCDRVIAYIKENKPNGWGSDCKAREITASVEARHVKGHSPKDEPRYHCQRWCDRKARSCMRELRRFYQKYNTE